MQFNKHNWPWWRRKLKSKRSTVCEVSPGSLSHEPFTAEELGKVEENVTLSEILTSKGRFEPKQEGL